MKKFILLSIFSLLLLHALRDALIDAVDDTNEAKVDQTEQISYHLAGDTLHVEIPFHIPYASHLANENSLKELIFVYQGDYYKVLQSVFTGDKLQNTSVKINPTKQEIFQILGQLITLDEENSNDPFNPVRQLSSLFADYFCVVPIQYTHWFWMDFSPSKFHSFSSSLLTLAAQLPSPPPRFI